MRPFHALQRNAFVLVAALVVLAVVAPRAGAEIGAGERRMQAFLDDVDRLRADFSQTLFDEGRQLVERSRGVMYLSRPDRFRWEYVEPFPQLIVGDGERIWIHDVELEQVMVRAAAGAIGKTPAVLLSSRRPVRESFAVRELGESDGMLRVALTPIEDGSTFAEVRLAFDPAGLRMMELDDNFGQMTVLVFEAIERNPALDPSLFTFVPPPGVDVVDDL